MLYLSDSVYSKLADMVLNHMHNQSPGLRSEPCIRGSVLRKVQLSA